MALSPGVVVTVDRCRSRWYVAIHGLPIVLSLVIPLRVMYRRVSFIPIVIRLPAVRVHSSA